MIEERRIKYDVREVLHVLIRMNEIEMIEIYSRNFTCERKYYKGAPYSYLLQEHYNSAVEQNRKQKINDMQYDNTPTETQ